MKGGEGTKKERSGCRRLGGDTGRLPPMLVYEYIVNGVTYSPSRE